MDLEIKKIAEFMSDEKLSAFIKENLQSSLLDIGFSNNFVNDLVISLPEIDYKALQKKYSHELRQVYAIGFFQDIVPDYFERHVFPEIDSNGTVLDIGCGTGILAKRLYEAKACKKVIGIDINPYPEWSEFKSPHIHFEVVKEKNFIQFLKSTKADQLVLTWTLHHMEYDEQERYLRMLHETIPAGTKIVILEDSYSENAKPMEGRDKNDRFMQLTTEDRKKVMAVYDWIANRVLAQRNKVPIPFGYRSLEEWKELCESIGFKVIKSKFIGFPDKRDINTPQDMFVLQK